MSVFPNSEITPATNDGDAGPGPAGSVLTVDLVLDGQALRNRRVAACSP